MVKEAGIVSVRVAEGFGIVAFIVNHQAESVVVVVESAINGVVSVDFSKYKGVAQAVLVSGHKVYNAADDCAGRHLESVGQINGDFVSSVAVILMGLSFNHGIPVAVGVACLQDVVNGDGVGGNRFQKAVFGEFHLLRIKGDDGREHGGVLMDIAGVVQRIPFFLNTDAFIHLIVGEIEAQRVGGTGFVAVLRTPMVQSVEHDGVDGIGVGHHCGGIRGRENTGLEHLVERFGIGVETAADGMTPDAEFIKTIRFVPHKVYAAVRKDFHAGPFAVDFVGTGQQVLQVGQRIQPADRFVCLFHGRRLGHQADRVAFWVFLQRLDRREILGGKS